ncbi:Rho GTPase activation protein, partial [Metschnikowia bicuspidata var. bicuspidata NRRL YB-4993]
EEDDTSLFIKPKDFSTIRIKVASTITINAKKMDDYNCTFSIKDRESSKEMWRIRKTYAQILSFDAEIRPFIEFFGLPPIPEKPLFSSATPAKVDSRGQALQMYFDSIFLMPHIPQMVLLKICRYISVDFVNPLDDYRSGARKEGFLIRRYKGLGTSWKIRWCQVDGPALEIYDQPGGSLIEQIQLSGSQIGRQSSDVVAEDRGYRHALLVIESSKSLKLSGLSPKHFFCAESDFERDEWIKIMIEFTEVCVYTSDENFTTWDQTDERTLLLHIEPEEMLRNKATIQPHSLAEPFNDVGAPTDDNGCMPLDEGSLKQNRKTKIRHLFPFRSKQNLTEDLLPILPVTLSDNQPGVQKNMQNYLERLDLSEELSKAVFGRDLDYAFTLSTHEFRGVMVPSICFRCLDFLTRTGAIYEEGIFRMSGSAAAIRSLKEIFNTRFDVDLFDTPLKPDIHTVSGLLKTYLRELPGSLFGDATYCDLQNIVTTRINQIPQSEISLMIRNFLRDSSNIDEIHYNFCLVIFGFLRSVIANSSRNKMSLKNVCIVFVPTLNISVDILSICLVDYDFIFGDLAPVPDTEREILDLQIPTF